MDLNDILLIAYYNMPTDCQVIGIVHIWTLRSEHMYATLSVCATLEILSLTGTIASLTIKGQDSIDISWYLLVLAKINPN